RVSPSAPASAAGARRPSRSWCASCGAATDLPSRAVHYLDAESGSAEPRSTDVMHWLSAGARSHERSVTVVGAVSGAERTISPIVVRPPPVVCAGMEGCDPHYWLRGSRTEEDEGLVRDNFGSEDAGPRARQGARDG